MLDKKKLACGLRWHSTGTTEFASGAGLNRRHELKGVVAVKKTLLALFAMALITCPMIGEELSEEFKESKAALHKETLQRLKSAGTIRDPRIREHLQNEAITDHRLKMDDLRAQEHERQEKSRQEEADKNKATNNNPQTNSDKTSAPPTDKRPSNDRGPKEPKNDRSFTDCRNYEPRANPVV